MKKILLQFIVITTIAIIIAILTSPFKVNDQTNNYELNTEVVIDARPSEVFEYLGNSDNASTWSVFVSHIETLNPTEFQDGKVGSQRRCFKNNDESGLFWDEEITQVVPNEFRELSIFNLQGSMVNSNNFLTSQRYELTEGNKTKLTFSLYKTSIPFDLLDWTKIKLTGYYIQNIFEENLTNIKKEVEARSK